MWVRSCTLSIIIHVRTYLWFWANEIHWSTQVLLPCPLCGLCSWSTLCLPVGRTELASPVDFSSPVWSSELLMVDLWPLPFSECVNACVCVCVCVHVCVGVGVWMWRGRERGREGGKERGREGGKEDPVWLLELLMVDLWPLPFSECVNEWGRREGGREALLSGYWNYLW